MDIKQLLTDGLQETVEVLLTDEGVGFADERHVDLEIREQTEEKFGNTHIYSGITTLSRLIADND